MKDMLICGTFLEAAIEAKFDVEAELEGETNANQAKVQSDNWFNLTKSTWKMFFNFSRLP